MIVYADPETGKLVGPGSVKAVRLIHETLDEIRSQVPDFWTDEDFAEVLLSRSLQLLIKASGESIDAEAAAVEKVRHDYRWHRGEPTD